MNFKDEQGINIEIINEDQQLKNKLNTLIEWCFINNHKYQMTTVPGDGNCMLHAICRSVLFQNACKNHHMLK